MRPIKPKYTDTTRVEWHISKKSREIIQQYSKYTRYEESELIDMIIEQVLEDRDFVNWLKGKRYTKKTNRLIFGSFTDDKDSEDEIDETIEEDCVLQ